MRMRRFLPTFVLALTAAVALVAAPVTVVRAGDPPAAKQGDENTVDRLIFKNGNVVEGKIISETDSEVEILVMFRGISAKTTYKKSEILHIDHAVAKPAGDAPAPGQTRTTKPAEEAAAATKPAVPEGAPKVYLMQLKGDFGWNISKTSLQTAFDDAVSFNPAVIVVKLDCGTLRKGFDGLWTSEDLGPIVEDVIAGGHRVVFWIKRASSGAAFLPFVSPEIYFMTEGKLGGIGDLSDFDIGDKLVNEKQISLRLGHAEGFAIKGGYDPLLIRAMARREMWLAWKRVNGKNVYLDHEPRPEDGDGWTILSDDGEGKNKDEYSFEGNDVLNLNAEWAYKLDVSKGTADTIEELVYRLPDIGRDYQVVEGKSKQIIDDWSDRIERAKGELKRLQADLMENKPGVDARTQLAIKKRTLEQIRGILSIFAEVLDPKGETRAQIDVQLEQIRQQFLNANQRGGAGNGGGSRLR